MKNLILAAILLSLSAADVFLTNAIIAKGGKELNPLMKWCMDKLGDFWWIPKTVGVVAFLAYCFVVHATWLIVLIIVYFIVIVVWNAIQLKKGE